MNETTRQYTIRERTDNDNSFIYSTWLNSYKYDSHLKYTPKSIYFDNYKLVVEKLLNTSEAKISCLRDSPEVILGYLIYQPNIIHYCFVKEAFRRFGIAKNLLENYNASTIEFSHRTNSLIDAIKTKNGFTYNPFSLYKGVQDGQGNSNNSKAASIRSYASDTNS